MKKILVIANLYPSKDDPTFGTFVKVFTDGLEGFFPDTVIVKSVIRGRTSSPIKKIWKYISFYSLTFYRLLFHNYDLVYVHYISHSIPPVWLALKIKKLNLAFNIHGDDLLVKNTQGEMFLNMARPILGKSRMIVVPSSFFKDVLRQKFSEIRDDQIVVSASGGVEKSFYQVSNIGKKIVNKICLGYVSRIDKGKGWDVLLRAIERLNHKGIDIAATIIGTGAQVDDMKEMIAQKNLKRCVSYLGAIGHKELPRFYKNFDLFIFPTMLPESLGLVGLEAMASGTPVVGSRIGGLMSYIIDGVNGFLFAPGNEEELAEKILIYMKINEEERNKMRFAAYNEARKYETEKTSSCIFEMINDIYGIKNKKH